MKKFIITILMIFIIKSVPTLAKIDLVTLPSRDSIKLTLYKSPDMTLVQETRSISLKQGINELQFSWDHTQIDPGSIDMMPATITDGIHVENVTFPAHMNQLAVWKINSTQAISIPMRLRYLTAGMDWRAYYSAILSTDEKSMQLNGYVRVNNHSGESFEEAKIYLVMGSVNMLESIENLASNKTPYGRPNQERPRKRVRKQGRALFNMAVAMDAASGAQPPPNVVKAGTASEYAIFEIDRKESLQSGWGKQLVFLQDQSIPVTNVYRFNPEKYGQKVIRLVTFQNPDQKQHLPLPGGKIRIYRDIYKNQHFSYEGQSNLDDIPVGKKVEISLGPQDQITVEKIRMKNRTDHYQFGNKGNIVSWEEFYQDRIKLNNTRSVSVTIEIICSFNATNWKVVQKDDWVTYEQIDQHSVKFCAVLEKHSRKAFSYDVHIYNRDSVNLIGSL